MNKIKVGDTVTVITGKDSDKVGKVLSVIPTEKGNRVVVEGVNIRTIAKKARKQDEKSEIVKVEKAIDASNVMVNCPTCNKPVRVKFGMVEGKKVRLCVKCGTVIADQNKYEKKNAKKVAKATKTTKTRKTRTSKKDKEVKEVTENKD